jgi:zinc protease
MVRPRLRCCRFLALLGLLAAVAPTAAAVRPPRLNCQIATLPNGLTVVLLEDHSTPIVHAQVWYHVGSKDERAGRTGFAHLFEHLMFKGSKNVQPESHTSFISAVGGQANAYTTEDVTVFWETVPSQFLPLILWLEADRMASLRVDKETFERERAVVMDAASVDEVREFYRTFYVPGNATLALVGDFDARQALALVTQYLGPVPRSERAIPRDLPREPEQQEERRLSLTENWPLPVVVVAYHVTYDGHPDAYPLHIASKVLSDGQSSRIYRSLVYEKRLALAAFGGGNIVEDPNLFYAVAIVQPGHTPAEVERALVAELDRLRDEPVTAHELERVKNQFARDYIVGRESNQQKARQLGHAITIHKGDVKTADGEFDIFMTTTAADVQRVARSYFRPENRTVLTIVPRAAQH